MDQITFDEWKKITMKVGKILSVERVENTDKLYKLQIDVGEDKPRQIVSGLVPFYSPEELQDKKIIVLTNLKPAVIAKVESNGMLLCAEDEAVNTCVLLTVQKDIAVGTVVT